MGAPPPLAKRCRLPAITLLGALLLVNGSGCRQGLYRANSLPAEFSASTVPNVRAVDLAHLGGSSMNAELIYPGDVLDVQMATGIEKEIPKAWQLRVREDGAVEVPLVGPVAVARMDLQSAENAIRTASIQRQVFRHPAVGVAVNQRRVNRVTVAGAVEEPLTYDIPSATSTLMTALLMAGGLSENASRYIEVRQPAAAVIPSATQPQFTTASYTRPNGMAQPGADGVRVLRVDLLSAVANGGGDIYLHDGAVVNVEPEAPRFIHVIGLVRQQQRIEVPPGENIRLTDAIALAGGTSMSPVIADKVQIVRKRPDSNDTIVIKASIKEAKHNSRENILLAPDDVVAVEETPITFTLGTLQGLMGIGVNGINQLR